MQCNESLFNIKLTQFKYVLYIIYFILDGEATKEEVDSAIIDIQATMNEIQVVQKIELQLIELSNTLASHAHKATASLKKAAKET